MIHAQPGLFLRYEPEGARRRCSSTSRAAAASTRRVPLAAAVHHGARQRLDVRRGPVGGRARRRRARCSTARFPNTWIDVNRSERDMDPAVVDGEWPVELEPTARTLEGLGLIKTKSRYGEPFQERKLTVAEIEERLRLATTARIMRSSSASPTSSTGASGVLRQISCHCMSAVGAPTHPDAGKPRADFCVSDLKGRTASKEAMALVVDTLQELRLQRLGQRSLRRQRADRPHRRSRARHRLDPGRDQQEALHGHEDFPHDAGLRRSQGGSRPAARRRRQGTLSRIRQ